MKRLIVSCLKDIASVNIVESLLSEGGWEDAGFFEGSDFKKRGNDMIMTLPDLHVYNDNLDKKAESMGFKPDIVIFPSEHAAASRMPALTVHPIGNFNGNDLGGREKDLVRPCPSLMTDSLRAIKRRCNFKGFNICFEATHHGPYLETPSFFIEIGSDSSYWSRRDIAALHASVIRDVTEPNNHPAVVGVGGGHYCPRFTELALSYAVNFGHMLPNYQWMEHDDEDIARMIKLALDRSGTKLAILHRKSMKGSES